MELTPVEKDFDYARESERKSWICIPAAVGFTG